MRKLTLPAPCGCKSDEQFRDDLNKAVELLFAGEICVTSLVVQKVIINYLYEKIKENLGIQQEMIMMAPEMHEELNAIAHDVCIRLTSDTGEVNYQEGNDTKHWLQELYPCLLKQ